eukprot:gene31577-6773_t
MYANIELQLASTNNCLPRIKQMKIIDPSANLECSEQTTPFSDPAVLSCRSSSPISFGLSFKTCGALTFTPAPGSQKDSAGPRRSNGAGCREHLSLLLHVLKANADAGPSANFSTSRLPIHACTCTDSKLPHPRYPFSNTHALQPENPRQPRTSDLITLGSDASTVHLAPVVSGSHSIAISRQG